MAEWSPTRQLELGWLLMSVWQSNLRAAGFLGQVKRAHAYHLPTFQDLFLLETGGCTLSEPSESYHAKMLLRFPGLRKETEVGSPGASDCWAHYRTGCAGTS